MIKYEESSNAPNINCRNTGIAIPSLESSLNASARHFDAVNCTNLKHQSQQSSNESNSESLANIESVLWFHFNNMLQSENISSIIESTRIFNEKIDHVLSMVYKNYSEIINDSNRSLSPHDTKYNNYILNNAMAAVVIDQGIILRQNITEFFQMLAQELILVPNANQKADGTANRENGKQESIINENDSETSAAFTASNVSTSDESETKEELEGVELASSINLNQNKHLMHTELVPINHVNSNHVAISNNSSINRRLMLNSISKLFKNKRKVIAKSNQLKQMMKQMIKLADKEKMTNNTNVNRDLNQNGNDNQCDDDDKIFLFDADITNRQQANGIDYDEDEGYIHDSDINTNTDDTQRLLVGLSSSSRSRPNFLDFNLSTHSKKVFTFGNENQEINSNSTHKIMLHNHTKRINSNECQATESNNENMQLESNVNDLNNFNKLILNELNDMEKMNSCLSHSITSSSIISNDVRQMLMKNSASSLTISKSLNLNGNLNMDGSCPLASEEQSCMSTPNQSKLSPSIDSLYKQNTQVNVSSSPLLRPNTLNLSNELNAAKNNISIKIVSPSINTPILDMAPEIRIECDQNDINNGYFDQEQTASRSPSFLGYITSASSMAVTPCDLSATQSGSNTLSTKGSKSNNNNNLSAKLKSKPNLPPLFLLPPSTSNNGIRSLSVSSNNLSVHKDFNSSSLGLNLHPSVSFTYQSLKTFFYV